MSTPPSRAVDYEDIQGLVRFGYKQMKHARFLLLRVRDGGAKAARAWLAAAPVTNAAKQQPAPSVALHLAFTCAGLHALELDADIVEGFSAEFLAGMSSDASRARRLGDLGDNDPTLWSWGGSPTDVPHVLVMLYAEPGALDAWQQTVLAQSDDGFEPPVALATTTLEDHEPFGFMDGISQPEVDWARERAASDEEQFAYSNLSCLGEYLLGYPNEYGAYTDRPLVDPDRDPDNLLARAEDDADKADFGRNGSYLVLRQLQQHVERFHQFIDAQSGGFPEEREKLAAAMVGRTRDGRPLAVPPARIGRDLNDFDYDGDPDGVGCPFGAHIRRSNPRNADLPPGGSGPISRLVQRLGFGADALRNDLVAPTRFHRLLRRGRRYGAAGGESGLQFVCLGANIGRQFEFVQAAWLSTAKFDGLSDESDPLLGHRLPGADGRPTDGFSMPQPAGPDRRIAGLPQFVTVRGGAYFFLPGIRALRYLSKVQP